MASSANAAVFIPQWDTTTHTHKPSRGGKLGLQCPAVKAGEPCTDAECDHEVTCSSPACQRYFVDDWRRAFPQNALTAAAYKVKPNMSEYYLPVASPVKAQRPITTTEYEARAAQTAEQIASVGQAAAVGKAIADALQPHLYEAGPRKQ